MSALLPPVIREIVRDPRLHPTDLKVYFIALDYLDFETYRPLKYAVIAHELRMHVTHVGRALRRLVSTGYLQLGPRSELAGPHTFRIPFSRGDASVVTTHGSDHSPGATDPR